jgi:2-keto-4-pentenoate hydratase/2-oxohepta-3-ene-1,7-dioic acid hydratase in catechol pathway
MNMIEMRRDCDLRLVTYIVKTDQLNIQVNQIAGARLGWISGIYIVDVVFAQRWIQLEKEISFIHDLPSDMHTLLDRGLFEFEILQEVERAIHGESFASLEVEGEPVAIQWNEAQLLAPLSMSKEPCDLYTPSQTSGPRVMHIVPTQDPFPTVCFSNHRTMIGLDASIHKSKYIELDFTLEIACIIGKRGRNIPVDQALEYVAGLMMLSAWSSCGLQGQEIVTEWSFAKKSDLVTSMGPYVVTLDELEDRRQGDHWDLAWNASINEKFVLQGNMKDLYWSFPEMIVWASKKWELIPGDVIATATASRKCTTEKIRLQPGDTIEFEVERLGMLRNNVTIQDPLE